MRPFNPDAVPAPHAGPVPLPDGPIFVEVGAGQGLFAVQFARKHPEKTLIAIERTQERFARLKQRITSNHCQNVFPIRANAVNWITHCLSPQSVDGYFFWYPNPYPKSRQQNKRFHAMPFLGQVIQTLKPGGTLTMATNQEFYYTEAKTFMVQVWGLTCLMDRQVAQSATARTHFEKKYLTRGDTCWELQFQLGLGEAVDTARMVDAANYLGC
jgi:tRNA G46 methylase TrmB